MATTIEKVEGHDKLFCLHPDCLSREPGFLVRHSFAALGGGATTTLLFYCPQHEATARRKYEQLRGMSPDL